MTFRGASTTTRRGVCKGDAQLRFWDLEGDLEQILVRSGLTYTPTDNVVLTLGAARITTGEIGPSDDTVHENRVYVESESGLPDPLPLCGFRQRSDQSHTLFDRNRLYGALGYAVADGLGMQLGYMLQTTEPFQKGQLQLSVHQVL